MIRLQKWLSEIGVASRREAERWILEGRVTVNGKAVKLLGTKVDPESDKVTVDGKRVGKTLPPKVYWLFNKPDKTLSSNKPSPGRKTIYEMPCFRGVKFKVFSVGRLDYRSEGLLLLTNDGDLCNRMSHPRFHVPRLYQVLAAGRLKDEDLEKIRKGKLVLEDGPLRKAHIRFVQGQKIPVSIVKEKESDRGAWYFVTVFEGRNRLVRRMFEACGLRVLRLVRYGFGEIRLGEDVEPGNYRQLKRTEISYLKTIGEPSPENSEV